MTQPLNAALGGGHGRALPSSLRVMGRRALEGAAIWLAGIAAALSLLACGAATVEEQAIPAPEPESVRELVQGDVIGALTDGGAHAWLGLPFAAPPLSDLRWRAPRPAEGWEGRREALSHPERCMQMTNRLNASEGLEPGLLVGSEDCLKLNIYAPPMTADEARGAKLPVMVWIYGGSNVWGWAAQYDPSRLAVTQNLIVVVPQYRVGPLGWFAHPALREDATHPHDAAANFALLDQIAALDWVAQNISAFGGDSGRVTIFGESAGGHNVAALIASPLAAGKFHGAIMQSGLTVSVPLDEAEVGAGQRNPGTLVAQRLGAETAEALRSVSVEDLFAAYALDERGYVDLPRVIEDGVTLPAMPLAAAFQSLETFNAVPLITGTNRDELKLFQALDPTFVNRWFDVLIFPKNRRFYDAMSDYQSLGWRILAVDEVAASMNAAGHPSVYAYRFDWDEGGRFLLTDLATLFGASHALEIPFVFGKFRLLGPLDRLMFQDKTEDSRRALSSIMQAHWGAFARNGSPGADWPRFADGAGAIMRFDSQEDGGVEVLTAARITRADLAASLAVDTRVTRPERCKIAAAINFWMEGFVETYGEQLGCPPGGSTRVLN